MTAPLFAFGLGTPELLIVAGIIVVLFGGTKLPELMRGLGQGIREFKRAVDNPADTEPPPSAREKETPAP